MVKGYVVFVRGRRDILRHLGLAFALLMQGV